MIVKLSDVKAGRMYLHARNTDWLTYPSGYDTYKVRIDDPADRYRSRDFARGLAADPAGKFVKATRIDVERDAKGVPTGERESTVYVQTRYLRGEYDTCMEQIAAEHERDQAARKTHAEQVEAAKARADALRQRLAALCVNGFTVSHTHGWHRSGEQPGVKVEIVGGEAALSIILDRLEAAEKTKPGSTTIY